MTMIKARSYRITPAAGLAALLAGACIAVCSCKKEIPHSPYTDHEIALFPKDIAMPATKAETTLSTLEGNGFRASAVTVSGTTETAVWTNTLFTKSGDVFKGGHYWPNSDPGYSFYGSNANLAHTAAGNTVTVAQGNTTDIVCAYKGASTYLTANSLDFRHILSKITTVTVIAEAPYAISNVTVSLVSTKTGGTYNLKTGAWSSLVPAAATDRTLYTNAGTIASETNHTGANNDYLLVPGTYYLKATWTATVGGFSKTFTSKLSTANYAFLAGKRNAITCILSGDANEITFDVSVEDWGANAIDLGEFPLPPTFGGMELAPGPLMYEGGSYVIKEDWDNESYSSGIYGKNNGSSYFNFIEMGQLFEKADFTQDDGSIENLLNPLDGWRLPTYEEWDTIRGFGTVPRTGATVNGNSGKCYATIQLTGVSHAGSTTPKGILIFPDNKTITGKALDGFGQTFLTTGVTLSELQNYLDQGCVFLPGDGTWWQGNNGRVGNEGYYMSASARYTDENFYLWFTGTSTYIESCRRSTMWLSVRLVRDVN